MLSAYNPYYSEGYTQSDVTYVNPAETTAQSQYQMMQGGQQVGSYNQFGQYVGPTQQPTITPAAQQSYNIQLQQQLKPSIISQAFQQQKAQPKPQPQAQPTLPSMQGGMSSQMIAQLPLAMQQAMAKKDTTSMGPGVSEIKLTAQPQQPQKTKPAFEFNQIQIAFKGNFFIKR